MTEKILNENGWVFDYFYPAGNENMFKNNRGRNIRVALDFSYVLTYSGYPTRQINSIEDLEEYSKTGK